MRTVGFIFIALAVFGFIGVVSDATRSHDVVSYLGAVTFLGVGIALFRWGMKAAARKAAHQAEADANNRAALDALEQAIDSDNLASFHMTPRKALLRKDEIAHLCIGAAQLENVTVGRKYEGGSAGIQIAKGVRIGAVRGHSVAVKKLQEVSHGELAITSKRIIFAGDRKSFDVPFTKLTHIEPFEDGIGFHYGAQVKVLKVNPAMCVPPALRLIEKLLETA
ncbi:MAG: hypothetical protein AB3X44_16185 [Leptothrix sp. (in: b-proteobacteria)]